MVWNPASAQPSYVDYTAEGAPTYAAWGVLRDPVFAPPEEANRMDLLKPFCAVDKQGVKTSVSFAAQSCRRRQDGMATQVVHR